MKKKTLKTLQKTNDEKLSLKDFEEETQLKNNIIAFQTKYNPFTIVNSSPDLLNQQMDLHGGLRKKDAA